MRDSNIDDVFFDDVIPWDDPSKVVDIVAHAEFIRMSQIKILTKEGRMYPCSDGSRVNLSQPIMYFQEKITHLSKEEQKFILGRKSLWAKLHARLIAKKRKAFGNTTQLPNVDKRIVNAVMMLEERGKEIRGLYSRMFSPEEVQKIVVEEFKLPCTLETAVYFRKKHLKVITQGIERFKRDYSEMRLGHKRGRMEELVWLYRLAKDKYSSTDGHSHREFMLKLLEQLRKESEGDVIKVEGNIDLKIEATINHHMRAEVMAGLSISQIIIGRVAAKMNVQPYILTNRLAKSAYSKFNGMLGDVKDAEYEELKYPSASPYEYDAIKADYRMITREEEQESTSIAQQARFNAEVVAKEDFKGKLLSKIAHLRGDNAERGAQVDQFNLEANVKRSENKLTNEKRAALKAKLLKNKKTND